MPHGKQFVIIFSSVPFSICFNPFRISVSLFASIHCLAIFIFRLSACCSDWICFLTVSFFKLLVPVANAATLSLANDRQTAHQIFFTVSLSDSNSYFPFSLKSDFHLFTVFTSTADVTERDDLGFLEGSSAAFSRSAAA